jgi:subtilisin family serine protease
MAISAMNPTNDTIAPFSNFSRMQKSPAYVTSPGAGIDLAAPGVYILTTTSGSSYEFGSGTSEACAHAAGLAALYLAANGRATNAAGVFAARQALIDHGQPQARWQPPYNTNFQCACTFDPDPFPEPLAVPSEGWVPLPNLTVAGMSAQAFRLSFPAVPGYTYTVQAADTPSQRTPWGFLTATQVTGGLTIVQVPDSARLASRFYRVLRAVPP